MKLSRYLLTLALCAAVFGAVACSNSSDSLVSSDESDGLASLDDGKKDFFTWDDLIQVFDAKADLPSCEKFEGVAAQVFDEKAFFACVEGEWMQIGVSVPTYDDLPKCNAPMNDSCIDVGEEVTPDASYICDEGTWVKGVEGSCLKGNENKGMEDQEKSDYYWLRSP